jgi:nucleotide-binding universal stress UspA family protein
MLSKARRNQLEVQPSSAEDAKATKWPSELDDSETWKPVASMRICTLWDTTVPDHVYDRTAICFYDGSVASHNALQEALRCKQENDCLVVLNFCEQLSDLHLEQYVEIGDVHYPTFESDFTGDDIAEMNADNRETCVKKCQDIISELQDKDVAGARVEVAATLSVRQSSTDAIKEMGAEVVYCGSRGQTALAEVFMGSFCRHLMRWGRCILTISPVATDMRPG